MKLKTIAALFRRNRRFTIYTAPTGEQWIGNGVAIYSLRGMPHMNHKIVLRIFDVPPDKQHTWICNESEMPIAIDYGDSARGERDIEPMKVHIEWYGENLWLFPDGRRVYTINEDYIKPLLDEPDYLTYHKRETSGGGFVLACKIGLEIKAIIAPFRLHTDEKYTAEIAQIASLYAAMEREDAPNAANELYGEQPPPPNVDTETGEIVGNQTIFEPED